MIFARDTTGISEEELNSSNGITPKERIVNNYNVLKASDKVRKLRDKIFTINDTNVRKHFIKLFNNKMDFLTAYFIGMSAKITSAKFYASVKDQLSILNWQVDDYIKRYETDETQIEDRVKIYK